MVKNPSVLVKFEKDLLKREKLSFNKALKIFEAMWREAIALGVVKNIGKLEGIEKEIRIAKAINGL